jgi:PleD family two-component response regulator
LHKGILQESAGLRASLRPSELAMSLSNSTESPIKPRVLIADDSRIVRATLIKHIEGMFEFREALDGEQAWETLLLDPNIRVLITDLTMPKLDGYGLLNRIRNSRVSRIRNLPVVVVSGSDEQRERERAKTAGATDLITKGIDTAQLLSRLDILARLTPTQGEFERSLQTLARSASTDGAVAPADTEVFRIQAQALLSAACRGKRNFVVFNVCIGLRHDAHGDAVLPPVEAIAAIGRLLQSTVRASDCVANSGPAEFLLATGSINADAARRFAERVCRAIVSADLAQDPRIRFVASCGTVSLTELQAVISEPDLAAMCDIARQRARIGIERGITGVIGAEEERLLKQGKVLMSAAGAMADVPAAEAAPDLATLLQWVKEGRRDEVLPHLGRLSAELQPLFDLVMRRTGE